MQSIVHTPTSCKRLTNTYNTLKCFPVYIMIHACSCVDHTPFVFVWNCLKMGYSQSPKCKDLSSCWLLNLSWWCIPSYVPMISYELWSLRGNLIVYLISSYVILSLTLSLTIFHIYIITSLLYPLPSGNLT